MPNDYASAHTGNSAPPPGRKQRLARRVHDWRLLPMLRIVRKWFRHDLRVLAYHRVRELDAGFTFDTELVSATPGQFRSQMRYLAERFHPVSSADVIAAIDGGPTLPRDAILVTFDDGYDDNHAIAYPILKEFGIQATFCVATGHIDSGLPYAYDWLVHLTVSHFRGRLCVPELGVDQVVPADIDARGALAAQLLERLKFLDDQGQQAVIARLEHDCNQPRTTPHPDCRPMTWEQLREMRDGGMEIGAHGVHHRMLAKLSDAELDAEITLCQQRFTAEFGTPATVISYPVGGYDAYDDRVLASAARNRFRLGFTYLSGCNPWPLRGRYELQRTPIERCIDDEWFQAILAMPELFAHGTPIRNYPA